MGPDGSEVAIEPGPDWKALAERVAQRTALLVGPPGAGKSSLATFLAERLEARGESVARITADPGQPSFGVPSCIAARWPGGGDAMWFVGSTSPVGHLLPATVGLARLADAARTAGAGSILIDASGLIAGGAARALAAHNLLAARAQVAIVVGRDPELAALGALLGAFAEDVAATSSPRARDRGPEERRTFRAAMFAHHFATARAHTFDRAAVVGPDWLPMGSPPRIPKGTVCGLLDPAGFCLGLGLVVETRAGRLVLHTPVDAASSVKRTQVSRLRLAPAGGYTELAP